MHLVRAGIHTVTTSHAPIGVKSQLPGSADRFGIMAPWAMQGAALEKNCGADARTIM